jgi:crotonobetainyl-CoA:carnitine CoA-transferase CaiB-like acyl-CoA transferase
VRFEALLDGGVDVIVDGYRTGALERLGYGIENLKKRFKGRGKGFVYVAENCFGFKGPWKERSGWQPIADAVSISECWSGWGGLTLSRFPDWLGVMGRLWG